MRARALVLVVVAAAVLIVSAAPSDAALKSLSWKDAVADASPVGNLAAPLSNPALDVVNVQINSDGKTVTWTLTLNRADGATLGAVPAYAGGTGVYYGVEFNYGDGHYTLRVNRDQVAGNTFEMQEDTGQNQVGNVSCVRCNAKLDAKTNSVIITTPLASLASGVRAGAPKDPLGPGKVITGLTANAGLMYALPQLGPVLWSNATDKADAPDPAEFTF